MTYKVTIDQKSYSLPPRTLDVDDKISALSKLDALYTSGELSRREVVQTQWDFVNDLVPDVLPPADEIDVNYLLGLCIQIISVYNAPALKAKMDAVKAPLRDLMGSPDVKQALNLVGKR